MSTHEATAADQQERAEFDLIELHHPLVVHQAEGVLRVRLDVRVEQAARALRERAAAEGRSVVEVARQIVASLPADGAGGSVGRTA
jgi:AmiR/NasT family two-component response regulator